MEARRLQCLFKTILFIGIIHALPVSPAKTTADEFISEVWDWELKNFPEFATGTGVHIYDDRLNEISLENYESLKSDCEEFIARGEKLLNKERNDTTATNLQLLIEYLQTYVDGLGYKGFFFPVSMLEGPQVNLELKYISMDLSSAKGYYQLIARYRAFSRQANQIIAIMREGIRQNMTLSNISLTGIEEAFNRLQTPAEESPLYIPFKNITGNVTEEEKNKIQKLARNMIEEVTNPAFKRLGHFILTEYMQSLRPDIAVSSLPNGDAYYKQCIRYHLNSELTPQEIHDIGLREVDNIAGQMEEVIRLLGRNMTRQEFIEELRSDPNFTFETAEEALNTYRDTVFNVIRPKLPILFDRMPILELLVEPSPPSMAGGIAAMYMSGSLENGKPGIFYIDSSNPQNLKKYDVVTLSMHEAEPGHHFQLGLVQEFDLPPFRKYLYDGRYNEMPSQFPIHTAYVEGWGLYAEFLGLELELYEDLYMRFGHLSYSIFRACRMVVDTGMHALGWSRQEAIDYMMNYVAFTRDAVETEVDRYITWPGQALAYKTGELKIRELRNRSATILGPEFDVRTFHDVVLRSPGSMTFLEQQVDEYIQSTQP